ncbi:D-alanine--D-alanine ligase family protein [Streptomyces flavofungini]|uniref:D-alanine--D-alanine ligase family protein n=1 Tax=Streptomyces flavofungini TaxID=68200 RepID=UPI0025AF61BD|nr:D-alanine--D-alanine ligase [Streptomyces flavofungini]WJV50469.1 D-alanine--D-alanine ligase [Streptomyces flavofungini]
MRIVVLCGAESLERYVSLESGLSVAHALAKLGHEVEVVDPAAPHPVLAGPTRDADELPRFTSPVRLPDRDEAEDRRRIFTALTRGPVLGTLRSADLVFLALHGGWGGDGHVQSLLEMAGIPFTGAGSAQCSLAWDKRRTLQLLPHAGVRVGPWTAHRTDDGHLPPEPVALLREGPVVVKAAAGTAHETLHLVCVEDELSRVLHGMPAGEEVVLTPYLPGREFSVGVLGRRVLPAVEYVFDGPFLDYRKKYAKGGASHTCPARIPPRLERHLREQALRAHRAVGLEDTDYSRSDFRCDLQGEPHCLEVNACPGLRTTSALAHAAAGADLSYLALIDEIVSLGKHGIGHHEH